MAGTTKIPKSNNQALYISTQLTIFADDNFYVEWNADLGALIANLEKI